MRLIDLLRQTTWLVRRARPPGPARSTTVVVTALVALLTSAPQAHAQSTPATTKAAAVIIETAALSEVVIHPQRELAASVMARNESKLSAEVSGVVLRWTAEAGSAVKKGEVLVIIDPVDFRLAVAQAQAAVDASLARLKQAEQQLKRSQELLRQGFFSQEALIQRETEVALMRSERASQQAQLAVAQRQLAKATLRAPFAGSVMERLAQTGEAVAPGTVLYVIAETGAAEVSANIAPADVAGLRRASDPVFATRGQSYPLRLLRVGGTVSAPRRARRKSASVLRPAPRPSLPFRWAATGVCCGPIRSLTCRRRCWCAAATRSVFLSSRTRSPASSPCPVRRRVGRQRSRCRRRRALSCAARRRCKTAWQSSRRHR
jgi:multidrug efflux pump subunit AcrA (membrane-fusion protein)